MVYCINSSLLLYIQQNPTGIKRGLTDERKQTKGINNNFICLLGRHLITFISSCWGKQREPGLHTKTWTYYAFFPPRGHGTGPTESLTVTVQYLGHSSRGTSTHTIPNILKILVFLALSHLLRYITIPWTLAIMTLREPTVLPSLYR